MDSDIPLDIEEVLTKEDGRTQVWRGLKAPLRDADGATIGVVGVSLDITERKAPENQLARLAERAELAQRAARSTLYDHDPATGYTERDPLILELAGYGPDAIAPTRDGWETLIDPEDRQAFRSTIAKAVACAERFALEYRVRTADGGIMWVSDVGRIVRDDRGQLLRMVGLITDITERREGEEKLRLRTAELESLLGSAPIGLAFFDRLSLPAD